MHHEPHPEHPVSQKEPTTSASDAARYSAGPSKAGPDGGASAPGVAEADGHQGVPEEEQAAVADRPLARAADEAALYRVARRRARNDVQRKERVDVRYSVEEKAQIQEKAKSLNIAGAHLVGAAVMAYLDGDMALPGQRTAVDDLIDELAALRSQIARIGTNANQIARVLNSGGAPQPVDAAVLDRATGLLETARTLIDTVDTASYQAATGKAADR